MAHPSALYLLFFLLQVSPSLLFHGRRPAPQVSHPSLLLLNHMPSLGLLLHLNPMPSRVLVLLNHSPWPRSSNVTPLSLYLSVADQEDTRRREAKVMVERSPWPEESLATAGGIEESWWWPDPVGEGHWWPDPVGEGRQWLDSVGEDREWWNFRVDWCGVGAYRDVEVTGEMERRGGGRRQRRKDEEDEIYFARSTASMR